MNHTYTQHWRRWLIASVAAVLATGTLPVSARAQEAISKETAEAVKTALIADLEGMRVKFVALAEAFPQDKFTWRPMEGVRSVSEVLMLSATESYGLVPTGMGAKAAQLGTKEQMDAMRLITDKAKIIEEMNKGFAYTKAQLEALDSATMVGERRVMGKNRNAVSAALAVAGDLHEHLGQLIAYARTNRVVPPWSN